MKIEIKEKPLFIQPYSFKIQTGFNLTRSSSGVEMVENCSGNCLSFFLSTTAKTILWFLFFFSQ